MESLDVDVLIVGAGLSGIDMACRLTRALPLRATPGPSGSGPRPVPAGSED